MPVATQQSKPVRPPHQWDRKKYGATWRVKLDPSTKKPMRPWADWEIERDCYLRFTEEHHPPGWLGKAQHFMNMLLIIWASPVAKKPFQINPNVEIIIRKYFEYNFLGIAGHASSSKTECCAIIAIAEFLSDPSNTAVLVTSTSISDARGRIWGRISFYWQEAMEYFKWLGQQMGCVIEMPGELVNSSAIIRYQLAGKKQEDRGIKLVPGRESEVSAGLGRMKGFKAPRMRFLADELSDLSHKLMEGAETNIYVGNDDVKVIGCYNPSSHFDPAGVFSEPEGGWSSVNVLESDGWRTKRGWCIRFDGLHSPNVVARCKIWEGLLTYEKYEELKKDKGDNSPGFMAFCRGCWSETGSKDGIYSEAEIINSCGMQKVDVWEGPKVLCGGFDPSFAHGGDRAALVLGFAGRGTCFGTFKPVVEVHKIIYLDENINPKVDKKEQILARLKSVCTEEGLDPSNLAIDSTGGGSVFVTLMNRDPFFAHKVIALGFGEEASSLIMNGKAGKDQFTNRMSELWYSGKPLIKGGQIRGLKPDMIREMTLRLYKESTGGKRRITVEPKDEMKKRLNGRSPDVSDSLFCMIHVCRARHGLRNSDALPMKRPKLESNPIDNAFSWGVKKKPRINEPEYAQPGGGWADDPSPFGGMFGGG